MCTGKTKRPTSSISALVEGINRNKQEEETDTASDASYNYNISAISELGVFQGPALSFTLS